MGRCLLALGLLAFCLGTAHAEPAEPCDGGILPSGRLFRPLLADPREPRFSASYQRLDFQDGPAVPAGRGDEIGAAVVGFGGTLGLWRLPLGTAPPCDGVQLNAGAGAFSQFDLDAVSEDLINTDFTIGIPVTFRLGALSGRVQLYHQSSHLGDEFLLNNPDVNRRDLNIERVDSLLSLEGQTWRIYGGGGYWFRTAPDELDLDPGTAQAGLELRSAQRLLAVGGALRGVAALDVQFLETRDWEPMSSLRAGLALSRGSASLRLLGLYARGPLPYGQFVAREGFESYGIEVQIEL